jgi:hypothetical protein
MPNTIEGIKEDRRVHKENPERVLVHWLLVVGNNGM